jgi:hypothetical protein
MALQQISVSYISYSAATPTVLSIATVVNPVSAGLKTADSDATAAGQTGLNAFDLLLGAITKRGGITFSDANGITNFVPIQQVVKIVAA